MVTGLRILIIRANDLAGMIRFYREGFGLELSRELPGRMSILAIPGGVSLEITQSDDVLRTSPAADRRNAAQSIVFEIDEMAPVLSTLLALGGRVVNEPFPLGDHQIAYIADPEGNVVGLSAIK